MRSPILLAALATCLAPWPQAAAAPDGTAVLAGRVVGERTWTKDGTPKASGVAGATIEVVPTTWIETGSPPISESPVAPIAVATSGPDGSFRIENLPAGRLGLVIRGPGIATELVSGFRVADGAVYRDFEFECRPAVQFASKLVRKDGGPVAGLEIVAWCGQDDEPSYGRRELVRTTTADDGSFRIAGSIEHPATLVVLGSGGYRYLDVARGNPDGSSRPEIVLGGDATLDVLVTDPAGKPVPDARVRLVSGGVLESRTTESGRCTFAGVEKGGFAITADAPGWVAAPVVGSGPSLLAVPKPQFKALERGRNERTLVLEKSCTLTGTVVDRAGGAPVAGARVRYATAMAALFGAPEARTDAAGRFAIRDVPRGGGVVVVDKEHWRQSKVYEDAPWSFLRAAFQGAARGGDAVQGPTVYLAAGGSSAVGKFAIERYAPLTVEVKDTAGKPVAGAHIVMLRLGDRIPSSEFDGMTRLFLPEWQHAYADERGRAQVDVFPSGAQVLVDAPGYPQLTDLEIEPESSRPKGAKVIVLEKFALTEVRLVDPAGRPVAGAPVWVESLREPGRPAADFPDAELAAMMRHRDGAVTDAGGKVVRRGWAGPTVVLAGHPAMLGTKFQRFTAVEGGPRTVEVKLAPAGGIDGRVELDGKPPKGARIHFVERVPEPSGESRSPDPHEADIEVRADGTFHLDCLLTGRVALIAYVPDQLESEVVEIDVKPGAATPLPETLKLRAPR